MENKTDSFIIKNFKENFIFFDGAMGTMLQSSGLEIGELPEILNISNPETIINIHKAYLDAGSDIITTNTFGANRLKLAGSTYSPSQIISAAISNAKAAISEYDSKKYIALDIGPIGSLLAPMGTLEFDEAYDIFKEQVLAGKEAGADIILIETMTDIYEVKAAILAAKENSDLPVFCTMSFQKNGRTFIGTDVATFVAVAEGLGADVLGANCSLGPSQLQEIVDDLVKYSSVPVMIQANAGLPKYKDNTTYYDIGPSEYSKQIELMARKGVSILGGCCGTTPLYIKSIKDVLSNLKVKEVTYKGLTTCTSSSNTVFLGDGVRIIGERINPTGKKLLKEALRSSDLEYIIEEAIRQQECGADILDVNVGLPGIDEKEMMTNVITEIQTLIPLPLQIDSADAKVIEAAARIYNGKPIINSVNGKKESMEAIFPIVKKYGCLVIGLTLDEEGLPKTAKKRLEIASKLIDTAKTYGIPEESILIDPLVLTVSAEQEAVMETLKSIPLIKNKYNVKIVLGASNVSFGLPNRTLMNTTYLAMALAYGLDAPITDPTNDAIMGVIRAYRVLANEDKGSKDYVSVYANTPSSTSDHDASKDSSMLGSSNKTLVDSYLKDIIIKGLKDEARPVTLDLLKQYDSLDIVNKYMMPALDIVGDKYEKEEIFLPQLLRSAETSKEVFEVIKEDLIKKDNLDSKVMEGDKIVMATVYGDIHDIGKNIVKLILENYGYNIIDLGKDVPIERIVDVAKEENVKLVGLSALMTTTVKNMELTIKTLKEALPNVKVMVGGAVLTADYAKEIGADYYSSDAKGAVDIAKEVFK